MGRAEINKAGSAASGKFGRKYNSSGAFAPKQFCIEFGGYLNIGKAATPFCPDNSKNRCQFQRFLYF
jgi:hypothetical protein